MSLVDLATMDHATVDSVSSEKLLMPSDRSLLTKQDSHVTKLIWSDKFRDCIRPNDHSLSVSSWKISEAQIKLLKKSGFYKMSLTGYVHLDSHLITAILDRWRPETNTFHLPFGEMTVTLEDVAYILGLPVGGKVVCGRCPENPREFVRKMLGEVPKVGSDDLSGNRIRLTWLRKTFQEKKNFKTEAQNVKATRAYILYLLGSTLFSDSGTGYVHIMYLSLLDKLEDASSYAWGAAGLAYLYRAMTKAVTVTDGSAPINLCGSFTLLMCWIFEHIPLGRPKIHPDNHFLFPLARKWNQAHVSEVGRQPYLCLRPSLDRLRSEEVTFRPYLNFPKPCKLARKASRNGCVDLVLTVFHVIAAYNASRCMPQFGFVQGVPSPPNQLKVSYTSRPSTKMNYPKLYSKHISRWDAYVKNPQNYINAGEEVGVIGNTTVSYKYWYERVTIRRVHPYTIEEAKLTQEIQILKEAAAEYSHLTEPYVKGILRDKRSKIAKLFAILAPYQDVIGEKSKILADSCPSSGSAESCDSVEDFGNNALVSVDNYVGFDSVESAESYDSNEREDTNGCDSRLSCALYPDNSLVLVDCSARCVSEATPDSIPIQYVQQSDHCESGVNSVQLVEWSAECGSGSIQDSIPTVDIHLCDKSASTEKAHVCRPGSKSVSSQGGTVRHGIVDNVDNSRKSTEINDLVHCDRRKHWFKVSSECCNDQASDKADAVDENGRPYEVSLYEPDTLTSNEEAGTGNLCAAALVPESSDIGNDEPEEIMNVQLPKLIEKITASAEIGYLYTPAPTLANDIHSSQKIIEGPNKKRQYRNEYVYRRRKIKPVKNRLVVRHGTRAGLAAYGLDDAPDSHRELFALVEPEYDVAIEYKKRKKARTSLRCEAEARQS